MVTRAHGDAYGVGGVLFTHNYAAWMQDGSPVVYPYAAIMHSMWLMLPSSGLMGQGTLPSCHVYAM